jgi:formylglycine-generating enzyme required for sulfatase activity
MRIPAEGWLAAALVAGLFSFGCEKVRDPKPAGEDQAAEASPTESKGRTVEAGKLRKVGGPERLKLPAREAAPPAAKPAPGPMVGGKRALFPIPRGMSAVPAGTFWMGCKPEGDPGCDAEKTPGRRVEVGTYFIDRFEVSVADYRTCVEAGFCDTEGLDEAVAEGVAAAGRSWGCNWGVAGRTAHPINCVSREQAAAYCDWANKRLPTSAEWEKAARGTDGRRFAWGNVGFATMAAGDMKAVNIAAAGAYDDGFAGTAPVGSLPSGTSPYGLRNTTGNVMEWVAGDEPVARGNAFTDPPPKVRLTTRRSPPLPPPAVGFRCAQSPPSVE